MSYHVQFPGLGLEMTVNRVAVAIGGFNIYWYGVLIALGMVLAMAFAFRYAPDFGIDGDRLVDVVCIGTVMAIVCARIYYVAFAPFEYESLWDMIDIRQGGIAIYGAVIGAFVFGGLAAKWRRVPILPLFDLVGICFLIGQGVGRWGNFTNQEVFGVNTSLPWGMYSEATEAYLRSVQGVLAGRGVTVDPTQPVHPTFFYEFLWCFAGFAILFLLMKKRRFDGELFLGYLFWYGAGRFWIEGIRSDTLMGAGSMPVSQQLALASAAVSLVLLIVGHRRAKGKTLEVQLAVSTANLKRMKGCRGPVGVYASLPASASHAEFAAATKKLNEEELPRLLERMEADAENPPAPPEASEASEEPEPSRAPEGSEAPESPDPDEQ